MTVILYSGEFITARKIEISNDHTRLIIDDDTMIDMDEVIRIVR